MRAVVAFARRRLTAGFGALAVVAATVLVVGAPAARADTAPPLPATTPATVSADALPTVQINGVVWAQVTVGNIVYATGSFTSARPAGSPLGTNETPRRNMLAYNITTGILLPTFSSALNAQGRAIAASPDGSTVFVGGDFTTVDGQGHNRVAAFSTATGALINTFKAGTAAGVRALSATNTTLYVGGIFASALGAARNRLAAFSTSTGALLPWAPAANDNQVAALAVTPDQSRVIVGGKFTTLNGVPAAGLGAVDATTGATLPWAANQTLQNSGNYAGITSLKSDGQKIYGTGFVYGPGGNLEGAFAADPDSGAIVWVEDCHGDSYDTFATSGVVYVVSHEHFCGNIGGFPQTNPWTWHRATAFTTAATGIVAHNSQGGYADLYGNPAPTQLDWYPTLAAGSYTGQYQAAWSATGNSQYLALGGEFPTVNGVAQQGLVRFAISSIAPNKVGPQYSTSLTPRVVSYSGGNARVSWTTTYDNDNQALTYKVIRDGNTATPVYTKTINSTFWQTETTGFLDTGLAAGSHTYKVFVYDPFNNSTSGSTVSVTVAAGQTSLYAHDVLLDGASSYWRLGEGSGGTGYDSSGFNDLTEQSGVGDGAPGAIISDADTAATFDGTPAGTAGTTTPVAGPDSFTAEAWFSTTSTRGGKILGFGNLSSGLSNSYDRHIYMDNAGHIIFGVFPNAVRTISSSGTYNDGQWHQVVASLSGSGMVLFVDGIRVAIDPSTTNGQAFSGVWRVGGDNLNGWTSTPSSFYFNGTIDDVALYPTALTSTVIRRHYTDSGRTLSVAPAPTDTYGRTVYADGPDFFWRMDDSAGPTAVDASPNATTGTYGGGVTYGVPTPVTRVNSMGVTFNGSTGQVASTIVAPAPNAASEELWFSTTTATGGELIGFGSAASGLGGTSDRRVWMLDTGQVSYGLSTGVAVTSAASYNDGLWHYLVAAQGSDGMHLYVDGVAVASNAQPTAAGAAGYWRVGGGVTGGGSTSSYFAGTVDEVAVYPAEMSPSAVVAHYIASPSGNVAPAAAFTSTCTQLTCAFSGATSTDINGTVANYAWDLGDGTPATGMSASHSYAAGGSYLVTLTVTDNQGATNSIAQVVTVTAPPPNVAPTAAFGSACTLLRCAFDGSASSDTDGTVVGYSWNFGDGTSGTGATAAHLYAVAGDYPVTLTVTDNQAATGALTRTLSPRPQANPVVAAPYAVDTFGRTVTSGLGTAPVGGAWTASGGAGPSSVSGGSALFTMAAPGAQTGAFLSGVSSSDTETDVTLSTDKPGLGNGLYLYVVGRRIAKNNEYRARIRLTGTNTVGVALTALPNSATEAVVKAESVLPGITYSAGMLLKVRFQVTGVSPTTLRLKVWPSTSVEPAGWQVVTTDAAATLQAPGGVGLTTFMSGSATNAPVVMAASAFSAGPTAGGTPVLAPTAAFTASCAVFGCSVDGSASSDPSTVISSYQWSWGDGTVTTGASSAHTFAVAGTYRITLTVTDPSGWIDITTRTVTVPA